MQQPFPVLSAEIAKRGIKKKVLAESAGICGKALKNKLDGKTAFLWDEVRTIQKTFFPDIPVEVLFSTLEDANLSSNQTN